MRVPHAAARNYSRITVHKSARGNIVIIIYTLLIYRFHATAACVLYPRKRYFSFFFRSPRNVISKLIDRSSIFREKKKKMESTFEKLIHDERVSLVKSRTMIKDNDSFIIDASVIGAVDELEKKHK